MMWIAGMPSDGMCYHKHTMPSLANMLHIRYQCPALPTCYIYGTICHHTYHNISQRPFGHITLVGYIPLKYNITHFTDSHKIYRKITSKNDIEKLQMGLEVENGMKRKAVRFIRARVKNHEILSW
jgi:hypothetical protein